MRSGLDVLHVDMDAFFAAVEVLDQPSLAGRAVIVGGTGNRGVVASCSYEARFSGVRSAMSMVEARRRCPQAVVLPGRHARYGEVSRELNAVFELFTPLVEPLALDEAFLDVSGSHRLFGSSLEIAVAVRDEVRARLSLSCSVGVARNKLLAKLASRSAKPVPSASGPLAGSGVYVVEESDELAFLHPRPVRHLWGVGPRTADQLKRYGIATIGDLAAVEAAHLERILGTSVGRQLHRLAWARDDEPVVPGRPLKSVGHEETFVADVHDPEQLRADASRMVAQVSRRLRDSGLAGRTVVVKVKFADFTVASRSYSLRRPVASSSELAAVAFELLGSLPVHRGVRLLGVAVSSLEVLSSSPAEQLALLDLEQMGRAGEAGTPASTDRSDVDAAVDAIRDRYGNAALGAVAFMGSSGAKPDDGGDDARWGPSV